MTAPETPDHERIWLQPRCAGDDRIWCQDNVWAGGCEDCGAAPTEYVRVDVLAEARAKRDAARGEARRLSDNIAPTIARAEAAEADPSGIDLDEMDRALAQLDPTAIRKWCVKPRFSSMSAAEIFISIWGDANSASMAGRHAESDRLFSLIAIINALSHAKEELERERNRLRVQLAGCGVAASADGVLMEWQPIETATRKEAILAFAIGADGRPMRAIVHWGCGKHQFLSSRHPSACGANDPTCDMRWLGDIGTHYGREFTDWMPLPEPPQRPADNKRADGPDSAPDDNQNPSTGSVI